MSETAAELWSRVSAELKARLPQQKYNVWFGNVHPVSVSDDKLVLAVANRFIREWIEKQYRSVLDRALAGTVGRYLPVEIVVDRSLARKAPSPGEAGAASPAAQRPLFAWLGRTEPEGVPLLPELTFDNYVVGPCNRMSHAAAVAVAESPGTAYNPFFIHGGVGLGKTHLLQAICHAVLARNPAAEILFLPSDTFVNHFIAAVEQGDVEGFRNRYRYLDVLVLDDIHFLRGKERTQEEFFHTFNALHNGHKQIVLSSDTSPKEITDVEERLVSRFKWGLVTRLDPPELETRMAIIRKKAKIRGIGVPDDVASFVAERVTTNIRELEGAFTRLVAYATLTQRPVSLEVAAEALQDLEPAPRRRLLTIGEIQEAVTRRFNVKASDLKSRRRTKSIVYPRQICMYLARKLTEHSLEEIGDFFGGRDHTTVLHAFEKIQNLVVQDPTTAGLVDSLTRELMNSS